MLLTSFPPAFFFLFLQLAFGCSHYSGSSGLRQGKEAMEQPVISCTQFTLILKREKLNMKGSARPDSEVSSVGKPDWQKSQLCPSADKGHYFLIREEHCCWGQEGFSGVVRQEPGKCVRSSLYSDRGGFPFELWIWAAPWPQYSDPSPALATNRTQTWLTAPWW